MYPPLPFPAKGENVRGADNQQETVPKGAGSSETVRRRAVHKQFALSEGRKARVEGFPVQGLNSTFQARVRQTSVEPVLSRTVSRASPISAAMRISDCA